MLGTVCFRERYRPLFQEARRLLADKEIVHIQFQSVNESPSTQPEVDTPGWENALELHAGFLGWGSHAIDYTRFVSGLDMARVQAFFCEPERYRVPMSTAYSFVMSNGATMSMIFLQTSAHKPAGEPQFLFYYDGGYLALLHGYAGIEMNGEMVYEAEEFLDVTSYTHVVRWASEIQARPAVKRGRRVNKTWGPEEEQVPNRHDAADIDKTFD